MRLSFFCEALRSGCRVALTYDGYRRVVEVHTVGYSSANNEIVSVFQVRGGSASGEFKGWKLLRLDEVTNAEKLDEPSEAPRRDYRRNAKQFDRIVCQLET